jgi:hypothetical protein
VKLVAVLLAAVTALLASTTRPTVPHAKREACPRNLRALKVWADPQRFQVQATPTFTDLSFVNSLRPPRQPPATRRTRWQKQVWQVKAQIVEFNRADGELRFVLYWNGRYMNAVVPVPSCLLPKTRQNLGIQKVWGFFVDHCSRTPNPRYQPLGAVVLIQGVGYWDSHLHRGSAPNGAELHPVTGMSVLAGCGV